MTGDQFQRVVSMGVYAVQRGWIADWRDGYLMLHLPDLEPVDKQQKEDAEQ